MLMTGQLIGKPQIGEVLNIFFILVQFRFAFLKSSDSVQNDIG